VKALPELLPREAKPFDTAGFGQNSLDIVVHVGEYPAPDSKAPIEELVRLPGGEIATALIACARLGCRTTYIGTVGRNHDGREVEAALAAEGVDLAHLRRVDSGNRVAVILVDGDGRRTVLWSRPSGLAMRAADVNRAAVTRARLLLVDAIDPEASMAAAEYAHAEAIPTIIDIDTMQRGVDDLLRRIDVIIASGEFVMRYTGMSSMGEGLRSLAADTQASLVVATMGATGSLARYAGEEIHTPAFDVPIVDTTGAGDAFRGGFMAAWLRYGASRPVRGLLEMATAVAAINCGAIGAQAGLPHWSTVDVLVTRARGGRSN
jgi:sulfofructose kinase